MAIALARKEAADLVIATDPDCDRMGVAVRNAAGEMELLTGNQIGSLMACVSREEADRAGRDHAGKRRALRDHQDVRHDRSAKGDRRQSTACAASRRSPASNTSAKSSANTRARCPRRSAKSYRTLPESARPATRGSNTRAFTSAAARKATATARRISSATRMATARWSCLRKSPRMRSRAA